MGRFYGRKKSHLYIILMISALLFFAQGKGLKAQDTEADQYRKTALEYMNAGTYGEAITLLNKYTGMRPRDPEGYNLLALCYERRSEYEKAVVTIYKAVSLEHAPNYLENMHRIKKTFHDILYKRIEGYQREIAIDPTNPFNYLEVGKAYRWLEEWVIAESWYDKYLAMDDDAAPDEIIRLCIILHETKNYTKGERWLKKYVERYPDDWRLWSRLGWFSLWLGKYKQAEDAFEQALSYKPYFKEAEEGLDAARRKAYIAPYYGDEPRPQKEYAIDKYYRILRKNPGNDDIRFKLINELVKEKRLEEAYQQLQALKKKYEGKKRFDELWEYVTSFREKYYRERIENATAKLDENPLDRDALKVVAQNYEYLGEYDAALELLDNYFAEVPDETDKSLLYLYARLLAWYKDFGTAIDIVDRLLEIDPNSIDYQLFRAQLSVWDTRDFDIARGYLENVYKKKPNNLSVLLTYSSLEMNEKNYEEAQRYLDLAKQIDPINTDVVKQQSNLEFRKARAEDERLFEVLQEGRLLVQDGKYSEALPFYEEYLDNAEPNNLIIKEYGDIHFRAGNYEQALSIYNSLLAEEFNSEVALQRGQLYFTLEKPEEAITDYKRVVQDDPENFKNRLYLTDAYVKAKKYGYAEDQLDTLDNLDLDSAQVAEVELRRSWIPPSGLEAVLTQFPSSVRLGPSGAFYTDDLGFLFYNYGSVMELGLTSWLSLGVSLYRTHLGSDSDNRDFTTFKGQLFIRFTPELIAGAGTGNINSLGYTAQTETDAFIRFERKKKFSIQGTWFSSHGGMLLYSPYLVNSTFKAEYYRLHGEYLHPKKIKVSGYFQYLKIFENDAAYGTNEGNQFQLRIGREFLDEIWFGYEYYYSNFRFDSDLYYSPIGFEAHHLWGEYLTEVEKEYKFSLFGKIGYVPESSFIIKEVLAQGTYFILPRLSATASLGAGSTSRDDTSYNSVSGSLTISWMVY